MLNDLYQYAIKNKISGKPGFKAKNVKWYISLASDGTFISIDPGPSEKVNCPDIGTLANGKSKCNIIAEKADIILDLKSNPEKDITEKREFYLDAMKEGAEYEPMFGTCLAALNNNEILSEIKNSFLESKAKPQDIISFKVGAKPVESSANYLEWWDGFRNQLVVKKSNIIQKRCFITGDLCDPVATVTPVSGLDKVGGRTSGDTLICFDKAAFTSYNLSQAENATVSEEAITAINSGLNELISNASIFAGAKFVHWYSEPIENENDLLNFLSQKSYDSGDLQESDDNNSELAANQSAIKLIESIKNGEKPNVLNNKYYIMSVSGASGRVMIRSYWQGSYEDLYKNFSKWFDDLSLIDTNGKNTIRPQKLFTYYLRLLKKEKLSKNISKRMSDELGGLNTQILYAIIHGTVIPDAVAVRALNYIRSDMLSSDDKSKRAKTPDGIACQLLKLWLIRKCEYENNEEGNEIMETLNPLSTSSAYQAGRLMAVYAEIQKKALGDIGAGVIQRYYASASTSPALVIGKLSVLSQHHLTKLNKGSEIYFSKMLQEIYCEVKEGFPNTLNLIEQSQFALGYYQQVAEIYKSKITEKESEEKANVG